MSSQHTKLSSLKEYLFTGIAATEEALTEFELPTSEPASNNLEYTLVSEDFPLFPDAIQGIFITHFLCCGQNRSGSSRTVNGKAYFNGNLCYAFPTNSSVSNNYYWTCQNYRGMQNTKVGDVLGFRLWASGAGVYCHWRGALTLLTRTRPRREQVKAVVGYYHNTTGGFSNFSLGGNPRVLTAEHPYTQIGLNYATRTGGSYGTEFIYIYKSLGIGRIAYGDYQEGMAFQTHSSYRPYFTRPSAFTSINWRELII